MGLTDVLFGRKKLKEPARDRIFALATAQVTLETELGLRPAGVAAVCFKPLAAGEFVRAENEIQSLLEAVAQECKSKVDRREDTYGFQWIVIRDPEFEDLVNAVHLIADELKSRGFGAQLLAAAFRFDGEQHPVYWIYGYKRGAFWPFVPTGVGQERDNAMELQLKAKLDPELPIEADVSVWFGFYDAPI
jgi:hypothetical protein